MRWNKKYNYPTSSRATEDGIRRYVLGETKLPSVTSILDATKSEEDKAALANWRERTGHKEADAITKAASSRGSQMHGYLESFLLGRENLSFFEDNEQYKKMATEIKFSDMFSQGSSQLNFLLLSQRNMLLVFAFSLTFTVFATDFKYRRMVRFIMFCLLIYALAL